MPVNDKNSLCDRYYVWLFCVLFRLILVTSLFSSVPSLSRVWLLVTPWTAALQASLSINNFRSVLKLMSIESLMTSNHLILCRPLLLLTSIFPSIRVFSNESVLCIRWPKYGSFSFSISPSKLFLFCSYGSKGKEIQWFAHISWLIVEEPSCNTGFLFSYQFLIFFKYLFGCTRSWLRHMGSWISVVAYKLFFSIWDLVAWSRIEPRTPALEAWSLTHWTTREVPQISFFKTIPAASLRRKMDW